MSFRNSSLMQLELLLMYRDSEFDAAAAEVSSSERLLRFEEVAGFLMFEKV